MPTKADSTPDMSGVEELARSGDDMAELLRKIIASPLLPIQDAARLPDVIDRWRAARQAADEELPLFQAVIDRFKAIVSEVADGGEVDGRGHPVIRPGLRDEARQAVWGGDEKPTNRQ